MTKADLQTGTASRQPIIPQQLSLWDTASLIVGIVVGTAIFRSPTMVFQNSPHTWAALGVWFLGGALCLCGALCYAELATTFPRNGGDYEYLRLAYGNWLAFLFGWAQLVAVLTGSIGAMAYAFADYGSQFWNLAPTGTALIAAATIAALTVANALGVAIGKSLQNVFTCAKIGGLALVVLAGLGWGSQPVFSTESNSAVHGPGFGLALVFVLYAYGGWNDAVYVAAEVRDQRRNLPRALLYGITSIALLYIAVNLAYLRGLGFEGACQTATPAADVVQQVVRPWGAKAISLLVMISALGAINGLVLAGSRIYAVVGEDYPLLAWLGRWSPRSGAPVASILLQGGISIVLVFLVGTQRGRNSIDQTLARLGMSSIPWDEYFGGFEVLVAGTAPVFWTFFLLNGFSLFVLRRSQPDRHRPFSVPWYPLPPAIFCLTCAYMLYCSIEYARSLVLVGALPVAFGIPLYLLSRRLKMHH
ncbi:MAG: amino acid permease [Planctomycetales bacterium]|nr:amino acid permease [Planctomycetales bacterium]